MNESSCHSRFHESDDTDVIQYRSVEPLSLLGLLCALGSIVAIFSPWVTLPLTAGAVICCLASLARIKRRPEAFLGRKTAIFGLGLALFCSAAGIAQTLTHEYLVQQRGKAVGREFLELIAQDRPEFAFQWTLAPNKRCPSDSDVWEFYRADEETAESLRQFVDKKGIRALLAIGSKAKIIPIGPVDSKQYDDAKTVEQIYAVTYTSDGKEKTFFFGIFMHRIKVKGGNPQWIVMEYQGGIDPWKEK
jgi:hypothetical protein